MAIDMEVFRQTYLEESFEGLDIMESRLLNLTPGHTDLEEINTIFRAAHSIKGGSGTFGFSEISGFTHTIETLLDEMRSNTKPVTSESVDVLLRSVDVLRDMLACLQNNEPVEMELAVEIEAKLNDILNGDASSMAQSNDGNSVQAKELSPTSEPSGWVIHFAPDLHLLQTGNEPIRLFRELESLGELSVVANTDKVPSLDALNPEEIYISWDLTLKGPGITAEDVQEVFEWVEDDCLHLNINPIIETASEVKQVAPKETVVKEVEVTPVPTVSSADAAPSQAKNKSNASNNSSGSSIRVDISKIDNLVNLVGEMVITQSMLNQIGTNFDMQRVEKLVEGLTHLERHTRDLQESVMRIRMLPISFVFNRLPRIVHDVTSKLGKKVELIVTGEGTELDKTVLEKLGDPLVHIIRNSVDHGIETPQKRLESGKDEVGYVYLNAFHQGGNIVIEVIDDGAGLNAERIRSKAIENGIINEHAQLSEEDIHDLIFQPGFSTAAEVTDISGRGVGMDVVRRNIRELGGSVEVKSAEGRGSTFTIRLPLTLAILDGQLSKIGNETYIFPVVSIVESIQVTPENMNNIAGDTELYKLRDEYIPILRLYKVFGTEGAKTQLGEGLLVVVEGGGRKAGIFVDDLEGQQQVVIKSLETNFRKIDGVSGATILGDGTVALIIDIAELIENHIDFDSKLLQQ